MVSIIKSYPKINLFLLVGKKNKKTNLHKIKSIFKIDKFIYDLIHISENETNSIEYLVNGKEVKIKNCIIKKTLQFLKDNFNIKKKYMIKIEKNIPIGSGLGSGSSNAAMIIKYILKNENINYDSFKKFHLLGSDIPFFLKGYEIASVKKYGNKVRKINWNFNISYNVKKTNINSITSKVYNKYDEIYKAKFSYKRIYFFQKYFLSKQKYNMLINDLEKPFLLLNPCVTEILNNIRQKSSAIISGSGSSIIIFN